MNKNIETMKLSQGNLRNIQKIMDRPFNPLQDTYQLKKHLPMGAATTKLNEKKKVAIGTRQEPFMKRSKANPQANADLLNKVNALLHKKM